MGLLAGIVRLHAAGACEESERRDTTAFAHARNCTFRNDAGLAHSSGQALADNPATDADADLAHAGARRDDSAETIAVDHETDADFADADAERDDKPDTFAVHHEADADRAHGHAGAR